MFAIVNMHVVFKDKETHLNFIQLYFHKKSQMQTIYV